MLLLFSQNLSFPPMAATAAVSLDLNPGDPPYDVELYSEDLDRWFDFDAQAFSAAPARRRAQAVPRPKNPYRRDATLPALPPGNYSAYSFPRTVAIGGDFDGILTFSIPEPAPAPGARTLLNISVTQP